MTPVTGIGDKPRLAGESACPTNILLDWQGLLAIAVGNVRIRQD
jgi:hypothetical protein